jgi:dolichyl-phosphate beta-glucosyltransferase
MLVTIIIPTFKEDEIGDSVDNLAAHLATIAGYSFEILIVDDSPDSFKDALRETLAACNTRLGEQLRVALVDGNRRGKGNAVKVGILASRGDFVFTMDADMPVPYVHVGEFLRILASGKADAVIAERSLTRNLSSPVRFLLSRGLFFLNQAFVFQSTEFNDTQCGFKAFRGDAIRALAEHQIVDGGMYDVEYLYAGKKRRWKVAKVHVVPNPERRASKINVIKCLVTDPIDLLRVKLNGMRGGYTSAEPESARPPSQWDAPRSQARDQ